MKICFCSSFLADEKEVIKNSKIKPSVATHKFNLNILEGIKNNIGDDLTVINTENVASFPNYRKVIIRKRTSNQDQIGSYQNVAKLNLPIVKDLTETANLYKVLKQWVTEQGDDELYICGYGRRLSHARAINRIKRKYPHVKTCMFLADLSGNAMSVKHDSGFIKQKLFNKLLDYQVNESTKFDSFVLLTKYMAEYLKIEHKPYTIIEGLCSDKVEDSHVKSSILDDRKIIAYTGILSRQYNVDVLLEAFQKIENKNYKLWLFGDGELNEEIEQLSMMNDNIEFFGFVPNEEMRSKLSEVTLLVNTRQNTEEYTKYSFPSKTIEYMTLGRPVLGYKLDGIPDEYDKFLFYAEDNSSECLKNKILEICEKNNEELEDIGYSNLSFVRDFKNSTVQTNKMLNMFKGMKG